MNIVKQLLKRLGDTGDSTGARAPVAPAPLIMALEPRVVYDASVAAVAPHPHGAEADSHASATSSLSATPKPVAEHDVKPDHAANPDHAAKSDSNKDSANNNSANKDNTAKATESGAAGGSGGAAHQVVFIDPSVVNYQTLIAGLPAGTQYVVLNANTDGFAQIAQYLQTHKGIESIHLISHGADGEIQAGSTWLNAGDLSAYSAELTQIGAEMRPGGDFLIYGCDVAQNADGKALVQNIAALTHLNVAASTDPTGQTALGGDWTLEYTVGDVHTPVIESAAAQAQYNALLGVTVESYDNHVSPVFSTTGTSFTLDGITYTTDQSVLTDIYTQTTDPYGAPPLSTSATDGVLMVNFNGTAMTSLTINLASGQHFSLQSLDLDAFTDIGSIYIVPNGNTSKEVLLVSNGLYSGPLNLAGNADFQNLTSFTIVDVGDDNPLTPTLNNLTYQVLGTAATTSTGSAAFTAGDNVTSTPVVVDNHITLTDPTQSTAQSATVAITGNFQPGQDVLAFTNTNSTQFGNIVASYNSGTGLLNMTSSGGTATITQWQNALEAVTYTDTAITPATATRTVTFTVSDGVSSGISASRTVTVADTDQTPTLSSTSNNVNYLAGSASKPVFSGVTINDRDNATMASATVSISGGIQTGDVLSFTNDGSTMGNITGSYASGVLTLTSSGATATLAQWDNALDAVRFSDSSSTPAGTRTVSLYVNDGSKPSATITNTVTVMSGPNVTLDGGSAAFVAGDNTASTPVAVDSGLTVSDGSSTTLQSATVSITGNFHSGEDILQFSNNPATMGDISASYNTGTGVMMLSSASGTATLAQWQAALRSITYTDTAVTPNSATRTVSFSINDGSNTSPTVTRTVTVADTDQTPTLTTSSSGVSYVAGAAPAQVFSGVNIADLDNTTMAQATVSIGTGFATGQDMLSFVNDGATMGNITASYNATTGVMTLSSAGATATIAQWDNALNAVRFSDAAGASAGSRSISLYVSDGSKPSSTVYNTVTVTAVPVVTTGGGSAAFVAGDNGPSTPVAIATGLTVTDNGSPTLQSATVSITGNFHNTEDFLSYTNNGSTMGDIAGSYNAATGVLSLTSASGTATLAQWQSALRSVTYTDTAVTPINAPRTISFGVYDGAQNSPVVTRTVTVADTDQTPIVTTTGGTTSFIAGNNTASTPVAIDSGISVSDLDNTTLASANVAITGNLHTDQDVLSFINTNATTFGNISASYNALTGVLTLTSSGATATIAQWTNALRAVTYTDTAVTPNSATRTISFTVNDGTNPSGAVTKSVSVTDVDQTPIVTTSGGSASFTAGDNAASTPVAVDGGLTVSDLDNPTLASATVSIGTGFHAGEDVLSFTNNGSTMGNITASYSAVTGVLTLSSAGQTATLAQWQAALRSVTYTDTAVTPNTVTRTMNFTVNDGTQNSALASRNVTVADTDQTPIVTTSVGSSTFVAGDNVASTPVEVDTGVTVSDLDNTTLASATVAITGNFSSGQDILSFVNDGATMGNITASYNAATGVMTLSSSGASATLAQWQAALRSVTYTDTAITPDNSTRTVSFSVSDGSKTSVVGTKTVTVTDVDQTPVGSISGSTVDYVAGTSAQAVFNGVSVSDLDNTTLASGVVAIGAGFQSGDTLSFTNTSSSQFGNIFAAYNPATGVLTMSSSGATASLLQWQNALAAIKFSNSPTSPLGNRTVSFTVNDGLENSTAASTTVDVLSSAPTVTTTGGNTAFTAADNAASTPVAVDGGLTVTDPEASSLATATVSIGAGFHVGEDVLSFVNDGATMGNIVASYDAVHGVLTLNSLGDTATLAQWQAALRSVTYTDTAITPDTTQRTVNFTINDGIQSSTVSSKTVTVADVDQTPILSTTSGSTAFTAGDNTASTPVVVDSGLTVSDLDNGTLASATVSIGTGFHAGEDVLSFTNDGATMGNITATYDVSTGVLTLSSASASATLAQWQAALRSVTYTDTAITPDNTTRTISFTISDGIKTSTAGTKAVTVTDVDQTPILTTTSGSTAFTAGDNAASTPVVVDNGITVSDLDNGTLASATVSIGAGFHAGEDVLSFINDGATMGNITASYDAATGVLTLGSSGASATLAQWQAALRSVTYTDTAITPDNTTRTISFAVNDGTKTSVASTKAVTVADVDQTPIVITTSGSTAFTAADNTASTPVVVDNGITVSDLDNATLASATVSVTGGFHAGEDVLSFVNDGATMGNITASYDAATGVLTLTSASASATLAQWQAALRSVTYTDTAITPDTTQRTISFAVSDGTDTSVAGTKAVTVTDVDQTPVVTATTGSTAFTAGDNAPATPVAVDSGITVSDRDNTTLASATVSIGSGFHAGEDVLSFTNDGVTMGNITATYDAATGALTLSSAGRTATLAQWQAALRAVTYTDTAITPDNTTRTISFTVNDGTQDSALATKAVTVADVDQTPIVITSSGNTAFTAGDNTTSMPVAVDSGLTVSDLDNATLASGTVSIGSGFHAGEDVLSFTNDGATMGNITATYNAATGVLTLNSVGQTATLAQWQAALRSVTYTDTAVTPDNTTRTISFTVNDGTEDSALATKAVTVADVDQTPIVTTTSGNTAFTAGDNATSTPVAVDGGVTVSDLDNTTLASATVSVTGGFHAGQDVLSFTNDGATMGNITATYNAATGVLTLSSAGQTATLAQWQAALRAVAYTDTAVTPDNTTRTISFTVNDGTQDSALTTKVVTVADVDQTPLVTVTSGSTAFTSGDNAISTPVAVDGGLTVSDLDNATLASATVSVTGGFHAGQDVLSFTNDGATMGNITATYNATTGVLTLSSAGQTATLAQWQAALRSVTYTDTAVMPDTAQRTIGFSVDDGTKTSAIGTKAVTVTATDQTPVISMGSDSAPTFASGPNAQPVTIAPQISVTDANSSATFASATVSITGGFHADRDVLAFHPSAATGNITATYNASTGVLTLSASGPGTTLAQWQAALASVTYADGARETSASSRTISFSVSDGHKTSQTSTRTVNVAAAPPTQSSQPAPATPTTLPPRGNGVSTAGPSSANTTTTSASSASAPDTVITFPRNLTDSISNPLIVLDAFAQAPEVGSIPAIHTATFDADEIGTRGYANSGRIDGTRHHGSLSDTSVGPNETTPAPSNMPLSLDLPALAVHLNVRPDQAFVVSLPVMLGSAEGLPLGADAHVELRLADGRPLPGWLHYDPVRGTLSGKVPANQHNLAISIIARDAQGHQTRRDVAIEFGTAGRAASNDKTGHANHGANHDATHGAVRAPGDAPNTAPAVAPRAALPSNSMPLAKPSLAEQFVRAHATLHVARPSVAAATTAPVTEAVSRGHA